MGSPGFHALRVDRNPGLGQECRIAECTIRIAFVDATFSGAFVDSGKPRGTSRRQYRFVLDGRIPPLATAKPSSTRWRPSPLGLAVRPRIRYPGSFSPTRRSRMQPVSDSRFSPLR